MNDLPSKKSLQARIKPPLHPPPTTGVTIITHQWICIVLNPFSMPLWWAELLSTTNTCTAWPKPHVHHCSPGSHGGGHASNDLLHPLLLSSIYERCTVNHVIYKLLLSFQATNCSIHGLLAAVSSMQGFGSNVCGWFWNLHPNFVGLNEWNEWKFINGA